MSSTRLPGKVLLKLPYGGDVTILQQVIRRLKRVKSVNEIIIATTENPCDDPIMEVSVKEKVKWSRGSENDVLARYYTAAKKHNLDLVVRITSDCPCIDPQVVDNAIKNHLESGVDYTQNSLESFPRGQDTEVFGIRVLEEVYLRAKEPYEREHVTVYIYNNPKLYRLQRIVAEPGLNRPDLRLTVDTWPDYALLCCIYDELYKSNACFSFREIVELLDKKPWLSFINKEIVQKSTKG
jgi:spore coat polysaccharide biosynthesis protein SpsF